MSRTQVDEVVKALSEFVIRASAEGASKDEVEALPKVAEALHEWMCA